MPAIEMLLLGSSGGAVMEVVPKLSTATAVRASITPTEAHTLVRGAARSSGR
jgi:hypothetical protein